MTALARSPGRKLAVVALGLACSAPWAYADQFHYNNVLIGTRAVGMGGAFTAVADDASGVYYNPAGLAFALSNDISGSANAFYQKKATYKGTVGGEDFVEESSGSVPSFFGGLQKLDKYVDGLVFAFGVFSVDSDLKDQNTLIENKSLGKSTIRGVETETTLVRYHRTANARASTNYMGAAAGLRVTNNIALGFGLNYFNVDELTQDFQHVITHQPWIDNNDTADDSTDDTLKYEYAHNSVNRRDRLQIYGVQALIGAQVALPANFSLGLTVKPGFIASQKFETSSENSTQDLSATQQTVLIQSGVTPGETDSKYAERIIDGKSDDAAGKWPTEIRLGLAWFATSNALWTLDIAHYTEATDASRLYARDAVTNFSTGIEYYLTAAFPLRFGLFTNNDARPEIQEGTPNVSTGEFCGSTTAAGAAFTSKYCGQGDHIDYMGESLFIAWVQPNSQIAAGVVLQQGKGKAQKTGNHVVQDVEASATTFAFSATHNL